MAMTLEELKVYTLEQMHLNDKLSRNKNLSSEDRAYCRAKAYTYHDIYYHLTKDMWKEGDEN